MAATESSMAQAPLSLILYIPICYLFHFQISHMVKHNTKGEYTSSRRLIQPSVFSWGGQNIERVHKCLQEQAGHGQG